MIVPKQLSEKFPYMFIGHERNYISIPFGWQSTFIKLCKEIDRVLAADKRDFRFVECKEKFGSARWRWTMKDQIPAIEMSLFSEDGSVAFLSKSTYSDQPNDPVFEQIKTFVMAAEVQTHHQCIVCGQPGQDDSGAENNEWILVLCPDHVRARRSGAKLEIWPQT